MSKWYWLLPFVLQCTLFLYAENPPSDSVALVRERLAGLPAEERQMLADFFRGMLAQGDFAVTLLGSKPAFMSGWIQQFIKAPRQMRDFLFLTYRGWRLWQKYGNLFPMRNFAFIDEGYRHKCFGIWFTKRSCKESIEKFLQKQDCSLEGHKTTGLLLGYPRTAVENFCEEIRLVFTMQFFPYEEGKSLLGSAIQLTSSDLVDGYPEDIVDKYYRLEKQSHFQAIPTEPFFPTSGAYGYRSFTTEEEPPNEEWKQKIADLYNSDHFLEELLTLFVREGKGC